jgi:hypothetical protein
MLLSRGILDMAVRFRGNVLASLKKLVKMLANHDGLM